jgi:serine/threonine-protein kinase
VRTAPGLALGERYRLERQIAVGGMGEVWQAYDEALQRPVAVKVLREEYAGDTGFLDRFRTEARNSAALSHPNIAALFDYGEQEGSAYLVMELVVGDPLSDILEREPVLPARRLLPLLAQASRGLHAAHEAGVVHRDVKPGNILIGRGARVKITDFGVSMATGQRTMTATGMVMGTAQYLSPEQAVGRPATPLSDLYSLGVVAYEALAGKRPFTGPTAVDIAVAHVNDPVPPLPFAVDKPLAALVMRLLSKDPAKRPASGEELARLFDELVPRTPAEGVPVLVTPQPAWSTGAPEAPAAPDDEPGTSGRATGAAGAAASADDGARTLAAGAAPPSYPPRSVRRPADLSARSPGTPPAHASAARHPTQHGGQHGPMSSTKDAERRLGRWWWPVVVGGLVLLALLGAVLADRLTSAVHDGPARPPQTPAGAMITQDEAPRLVGRL